MTDAQKYRMRLVHAHMDYITSTISDIDSMIDSLVEPYENAVQLLCTIPGIDRSSRSRLSLNWYGYDTVFQFQTFMLLGWPDSR